MKNPFALLRESRRGCGDIFSLDILGLGEWIFLCSPELVEEMFKSPEEIMSAAEANRRFLGVLLGYNATPHLAGKAHLERRRFSSSHLNGRQVLRHIEMIEQVTMSTINRWPVGQNFSLLPHTQAMILEILFRVVSGCNKDSHVNEFVVAAQDFFEKGLGSPLMVMPFLQWDLGTISPWGRVMSLRRRLRAILLEEIKHRRAESGTGRCSILSSLVSVDSEGENVQFSDDVIVDEIINIISAGQETSSRILAWTIFGVLSTPGVLDNIRAEIDSVVGQGSIKSEHIPELEYLDAVINEGIRFRPLGPFSGGRLVKKSTTLGNYEIPQGVIVAHCHAEICYKEDLFPDPHKFNPNNFHKRKFKTFQWSPFGGGPRVCLGRGLALLQLKTILATIFRSADLRLCNDDVKAVRSGFLFVPKDGMPIELRRRL